MTDPNSNDRGTDGPSEASTDSGPPTRTEDAGATDIDSGIRGGERPDTERGPHNESTQVATDARRPKTSLISLLIAALGAWVALSTLVFETTPASLWNDMLVGLAVGIAAAYNYYRVTNDIPLSTAIASLVAILGIWLIVSSALLEMTGGLFWSTIVSGLLIAGLAGYNAYEARDARTVVTDEMRT